MTFFNEDDFNLIFHQNKKLLYKYCLKYLENKYDAEEVMIGVYIELFKKWDNLYKENIKAWLYRTADNLIKQKRSDIQKNKNVSFTELIGNKTQSDLKDNSLFKDFDFSETYIEKINSVLTPLRRFIFNQKFIENKKTIDIVTQIGLPYSTVSDKIVSIRKTAQKILIHIIDNQLC